MDTVEIHEKKNRQCLTVSLIEKRRDRKPGSGLDQKPREDASNVSTRAPWWDGCVYAQSLQVSSSLRPQGLQPSRLLCPWAPMPRLLCPCLLARILEWVAIPSSRGSSQPMDQTCVSCVFCIWFFTAETPLKPWDSYLDWVQHGGWWVPRLDLRTLSSIQHSLSVRENFPMLSAEYNGKRRGH